MPLSYTSARIVTSFEPRRTVLVGLFRWSRSRSHAGYEKTFPARLDCVTFWNAKRSKKCKVAYGMMREPLNGNPGAQTEWVTDRRTILS